MTANAFTEDRDTCLAAGMCEYASKPVKWEFLEALLKRAHQVATGQSECLCQRDKYGCALT
jgi:CheY-like chemotaxis protein